MKKLLGIFAFLLIIYGALLAADEGARTGRNHYNLGKRIGHYGIICLGAGILIASGGIDLSIGAVVGLSATLTVKFLTEPKFGWHPAPAILAVLGIGALIGWFHGILVTKLRLQAFIVTLCGWFIYRGLARWSVDDQVAGLGDPAFDGLKEFLYEAPLFACGEFSGIPRFLVIFLLLAGAATVLMHASVYGRYLFAIGSNERAARYSGIATDRYRIVAYMICATLAAFYGVLYPMQYPSAQPQSTGNTLELYAIAGAVLGGCSLRGGEGTVLGIIIGTAILVLLPNLSFMYGVPSTFEYAVIGAALLLAAVADELLRREGWRAAVQFLRRRILGGTAG